MIPRRYGLGVLLFVGAIYFVARSGTPERTPWPKWLKEAPIPVLCVQFQNGRCRFLQALWPLDDRRWVTPAVPFSGSTEVFWRRGISCTRSPDAGGLGPAWSLWRCATPERPQMEGATWEDLIPGTPIFGYGLRDGTWQEISLEAVTWEYRDGRWWLLVRPVAAGLLPGTPVWTLPGRRLIGLAVPPARAGEDWAVWVLSPHLTTDLNGF